MRECSKYEITVENLLNVIHCSTEKIKIYVISDFEMINDKWREHYITEDFSGSQEEIDRVLKYYGDVPVWNIHIEHDDCPIYGKKGKFVVASIVANCHYADAREGLLREKDDIRKAKRREYNQRRKK